MEDQDQPTGGVKVRGRIDRRALAALFARADVMVEEGGPRFSSGIGQHGRLGRALLEELFTRARVVQGSAPRLVDDSTQTEEVRAPTLPDADVLADLDERIGRVAADAEAQRRDPAPSKPRRDTSDRLTESVVGSVLNRLDEVLGSDEPGPVTTGWSSFGSVVEDLPEDPAVPTLDQLNKFLTESTDDQAAAMRTYLEDLEMPEPGESKGELEALLAKSDEFHFEGYEEDLERLLVETYERYRSVPDALRVDPQRADLDLIQTDTLEERRADRQAEALRPRTHQTEQLARPPRPSPQLPAMTPAAPPVAPPPAPTVAGVDPFQLDPFTGQPAHGAPGSVTPAAHAGGIDPFKLDPFTGRPLAEGEAPQVIGPPPSGVHNLPPQPLFPNAPPGGFYSQDGPPLHTNVPNDLPFSADPLPAAGFRGPGRPPVAGPTHPPVVRPTGAPSPATPFPTSPMHPSPSQTGGFNPMEDPGSAARLPVGPPPERTPARGLPRPGIPRRVESPLTPGVPPIYPVESGEFGGNLGGPGGGNLIGLGGGNPFAPPQPARPVDPRQAFEQQLLLTGVRGMLERANPPRGQAKSTEVTVLHDRNRDVFRAPLHPRLEAGDRFQLLDGRIYRVLSSELVFLDGAPCFQEAACGKLGHMNAPLRDSWDQT